MACSLAPVSPERIRQTVVAGLGLFTAVIGVSMFLNSGNEIVVLGSLLVGGILGEWWRIEYHLQQFGAWLEKKFAGGTGEVTEGNRFIRGFLTASLGLLCRPDDLSWVRSRMA